MVSAVEPGMLTELLGARTNWVRVCLDQLQPSRIGTRRQRSRHSRDRLAQRGGVGPRTAVAIIASGAAVSCIQEAVTMQAVVSSTP
jgi:hypothetical protein